jgi:DNA-binding PadR family transcriptional regulator
MINKHQPMTRTQLTRRGLSNLKVKMPELKKLIKKAERAKLIESVTVYKSEFGAATTTFMITVLGKEWLEEQ